MEYYQLVTMMNLNYYIKTEKSRAGTVEKKRNKTKKLN